MGEIESLTIQVAAARLQARIWGSGPADIVMLHDGLGTVAQWREIPADIASATGKTVLAYDRAGHGDSTPTPRGAWPADWLHREAIVLGEILANHAVPSPVLVGHSDGASIALIHAATGAPLAGVVSLAAHSWVEPLCSRWIAKMRADANPIVDKLGRHHAEPAAIFEAWSGGWVSDAFATWDIRPLLHQITAPVLAAQGAEDEYVAQSHVTEIAALIGDNATSTLLPGLHHLLHHEDPDQVVSLVRDFVNA